MKRLFSYRTIDSIKDFGFAVPTVAFLIVFIYYPIINSVTISFTDWNMVRPVKKYVGFANYEKLLTDDRFYHVLKVTFTYTVFDVILTLAIGLFLALLLNRTTKAFGFMRVIVFMPYYISMVIASMIFLWIFNNSYGLINQILNYFGYSSVQWLTNPKTALWPLIIVSVWKGVGFAMIIFLAGLRGVPTEYYEASSIDGASKYKQFFSITLPLLSPVTFFLVITNFISSMQVFQSIDIMTKGGPLDATNAIVYWIFTMAFDDFRTGRAMALVVIFFAIIIALTLIQFLVSRNKVHYEG